MSEWGPITTGVFGAICLLYTMFTIFATFEDWKTAEQDNADKAENEGAEGKEKAAEKLVQQKNVSKNEKRTVEKEKQEGDKPMINEAAHKLAVSSGAQYSRDAINLATILSSLSAETHLEAMINLLEKRQDEAETENNKLKDQLASYKNELTAAVATISGIRETVDNHESTIDSLRTEVEELEASADRRRATVASLGRSGRGGPGGRGERGGRNHPDFPNNASANDASTQTTLTPPFEMFAQRIKILDLEHRQPTAEPHGQSQSTTTTAPKRHSFCELCQQA
ncbi:hypothetical protein EDB80DRAFT_681318 [Ilyonectria destructans]|nr:hypothetical protein EDB80DRAFT_681318 [Ilyonectria destructans]